MRAIVNCDVSAELFELTAQMASDNNTPDAAIYPAFASIEDGQSDVTAISIRFLGLCEFKRARGLTHPDSL